MWVLRCSSCRTEVILDMESTYKPVGKRLRSGFAVAPPVPLHFDSAVKPALDRFKAVYASLAGLENVVRFRVLSPDTGAA